MRQTLHEFAIVNFVYFPQRSEVQRLVILDYYFHYLKFLVVLTMQNIN